MNKTKRILLAIFVFLSLENIIFSINAWRKNSPVLGLKLNGKQATNFGGPLKLVYQNKSYELKLGDINSVLDAGRRSGLIGNFVLQNQAILGFKNINLENKWLQSQISLKILEMQSDINKEALPIRPDFAGDMAKTLPAVDGTKVNVDKLTVLIADNIFNPPNQPIQIPVIKTFTSHQESELTPLRRQAKQLSVLPLAISSGGLVFTLTPQDIREMMILVERPDVHNSKKSVLQLRLDEVKLNRKLGDYAKQVEDITHAEFDDHDARVAIYSQFYALNRHLVSIPTGANKKVLGVQSGVAKIVYLTFDDGPNSLYHPMILDILRQNNIKATFFLVGQNVKRDSEIAQRTVAEGHRIGNHSLTHAFLPKLNNANILAELKLANEVLNPINQHEITLFRPPYGGINLAVKQSADDLHMKLYLWDVDPRDWSEPSVDELVRRVTTAVFPGADVLLHSNHLVTAKALPKIIEILKSQGYGFEQLQ